MVNSKHIPTDNGEPLQCYERPIIKSIILGILGMLWVL